MYAVIIARAAFKIIKKFTPSLRNCLVKELEDIAKNPQQAPQLVGKFSFLRSWHTYFQGVPYRIIFETEEKTRKVVIYLIAKRANVYQLLERLF